ncbi:hypothetical protein [Deinococcus multiflagellatus]|uniref:hypothetical protein n=1 Tax=Deinococcus multiflagellatus TaxID=1656887 RepID=UPI001CCEC650|nr:hypothetical protein [Deinococcus multiflagellatus]MBZ9714178.1 hypothetical protein [Deinococcus multiflagellatus]
MSQSRRTLNTLIRLGRALREDAQSPEATQSPLRAAGQAAAARVTPTLQDAAGRLRAGAQGLRDQVQARADDRLERLITERHPGGPSDPEARAVLARRREAREARAAQAQARAGLLAQAQTPEQRQVLGLVAAVTPWAGGEPGEVRYTTLLDRLAPGGDPAREMAIHRALWTLAERQVLAVSPHGVVTAPQPRPPLALPPS